MFLRKVFLVLAVSFLDCTGFLIKRRHVSLKPRKKRSALVQVFIDNKC